MIVLPHVIRNVVVEDGGLTKEEFQGFLYFYH